jgi:hypothetical protein
MSLCLSMQSNADTATHSFYANRSLNFHFIFDISMWFVYVLMHLLVFCLLLLCRMYAVDAIITAVALIIILPLNAIATLMNIMMLIVTYHFEIIFLVSQFR